MQNKNTMNKYFKLLLFTLIGSGLGYLYFYFWGCDSGCNIQSSGMNMSLYGALFGLVLGFPTKKKKSE